MTNPTPPAAPEQTQGTPLTDAEAFDVPYNSAFDATDLVDAEFARDLERQLYQVRMDAIEDSKASYRR